MKKIISTLLKIILFAMAVFLGFTYGMAIVGGIMNGEEGRNYVFAYLLEVAVALFLTCNLNVIVHEGGHLVFGLATGYRFSSFRIWSLMFIRQDGGIKLRKFKLAGTGGQCLMIPPKKGDTKASVILYNLGGVIFNLIFALICLVLYRTLPNVYILSKTLKWCAVFSLFFMITNGIPLNVGGIANDGMNALHLSKNKDAAEAFRKQLLANAAQTEGKRISEMPDEWFRLPEGADMQNVHCASLAVFAASRHLDRGDIITAEQEISRLLSSNYNIIGLHRNLLTCDLISTRLINNPNADISSFLTPTFDKFVKSMKNYPSVIRTQYIIALLSERDDSKAEEILNSFDKLTANFPYRQEIESEHSLMTKALEKTRNDT